MGITARDLKNDDTTDAGFNLVMDNIASLNGDVGMTKIILGASGVDGGLISDSNPLPVIISNDDLVSTNNSSTDVLAGGAVFTGTGEDTLGYSSVTIQLDASHDSATDGMTFQFSIDNTNWDDVKLFTYSASNGARRFSFPTQGRYFRIVYTNGSTLQTHFRLQVMLKRQNILPSIHRLADSVDPDRSAQLVKSVILAQSAGSGDYNVIQATAAANLKVSIEEIDASALMTVANDGVFVVQEDGAALTALQLIDDPVFADDAAFTLASSKLMAVGAIRRNDPDLILAAAEGDVVPLRVDATGKLLTKAQIFDPGTVDSLGRLLAAEAVNQIDIQFFRDTPANLTTVSVAGGGATSQLNGGGKWETSTATTCNAKSVTTQNTIYRSGSEVYCIFTVLFTTPTDSTNVNWQRIGLYDDNNGFFMGYEKDVFGITTRRAASDVQVAKASFSEDTLTGAAGSFFTRDGVPEAVNFTKFNVFRIRFGWFGSAPAFFEILSPDGHWVIFHMTLQPNNATFPHIEDPDLPMTLHANKASSDGTNLVMRSNCWAAGVTTGALPLNETLTDETLATINRNVIVGKTAGGDYINVQTTNSGNLKIALDEYDGVPVGGGVEAGCLRVTIANDSTGLLTVDAVQLDIDDLSPLADGVSSADDTSQIMDGLTNLTPKFANATISSGTTDGAIVAAVGGKKIRVLCYTLMAGGTATDATFNTKPAGAGSRISMAHQCGRNGGAAPGYCKVGHFETVSGEGLTMTTSAGSTIEVQITYIEI